MSRKHDNSRDTTEISTNQVGTPTLETPMQVIPATTENRARVPANADRKAASKAPKSLEAMKNSGEMLGTDLQHPHKGR